MKRLSAPLLAALAWAALGVLARPARADAPAGPDGPSLYLRHCAVCHGASGRGDGPAAELNWPRPRDFGRGRFRLVSSQNGVPTPDDLFATITRGIPGTGMPAWGHVSEAERRALVEVVLGLARDGGEQLCLESRLGDEMSLEDAAPLATRLLAFARGGGPEASAEETERIRTAYLDAIGETAPQDDEAARDIDLYLRGLVEEARSISAERMTPGPPILEATASWPASTPESVERGRALFLERCAPCHGQDGRGHRDPAWRTEEGEPIASRDLVLGRLKGEVDPPSIFRRIHAGIPGTPMPATTDLDDERTWAIVHYILSLRDLSGGSPREAALGTWWMPLAANEQALAIDHDFYLTLGVTGAVGLSVLLALAFAIGRALLVSGTGVAPIWAPGNRRVEAVWIAIPAVIVVAMVINSWVVFQRVTRPLDDAIVVRVTGRQFFWSFDLPEHGVRSTGSVAVPAGRPIRFDLGSEDVIHSFFLPHVRMKRDAIPGMTTTLWVRPFAEPGIYPILCNQFCGTDHAIMNATLEVLDQESFDRWIALRQE